MIYPRTLIKSVDIYRFIYHFSFKLASLFSSEAGSHLDWDCLVMHLLGSHLNFDLT